MVRPEIVRRDRITRILARLQHHADKRFHRNPPPFVQPLDVQASQVFLRAVPEIDLECRDGQFHAAHLKSKDNPDRRRSLGCAFHQSERDRIDSGLSLELQVFAKLSSRNLMLPPRTVLRGDLEKRGSCSPGIRCLSAEFESGQANS